MAMAADCRMSCFRLPYRSCSEASEWVGEDGEAGLICCWRLRMDLRSSLHSLMNTRRVRADSCEVRVEAVEEEEQAVVGGGEDDEEEEEEADEVDDAGDTGDEGRDVARWRVDEGDSEVW